MSHAALLTDEDLMDQDTEARAAAHDPTRDAAIAAERGQVGPLPAGSHAPYATGWQQPSARPDP